MTLAEKLEAVLAGTLTLQSVLDDPKNFEGPYATVYHGLWHFLIDADIRTRDHAYREMQEREMRRLINLLKSGADETVLTKVTFLSASGK